jgi:flagellar basal-body rod modification protein FlgD
MDGMMMNSQDVLKTRMEVETFNKTLIKNGRRINNTLGKDDFLKLLIVQLENQDPTRPLEDKEFISQMAQFSSLEQMTEMNKTLSNLIINYKSNLSYSLLGKMVEVLDSRTGELNSGLVKEVSFKESGPEIVLNGMSYSIDDVTRVLINTGETK